MAMYDYPAGGAQGGSAGGEEDAQPRNAALEGYWSASILDTVARLPRIALVTTHDPAGASLSAAIPSARTASSNADVTDAVDTAAAGGDGTGLASTERSRSRALVGSNSEGEGEEGGPPDTARVAVLPTNLGSYTWFDCARREGHCDSIVASLPPLTVDSLTHVGETSPLAYVQGVVAYVVAGAVAAVLCVVVAACVCLGRAPLCRCSTCGCRNGCCGGRRPTARRRRCCSWGYEMPDQVAEDSDDSDDDEAVAWATEALTEGGDARAIARRQRSSRRRLMEKMRAARRQLPRDGDMPPDGAYYSGGERWCARLCVGMFVVAVCVAIGVGVSKGNRGISASLTDIVDSPAGIEVTLRGTMGPFSTFVQSTATEVIVPGLLGINATIQAAVDVQATRRNVDCVSSTLSGLPSPAGLVSFVDQVNATVVRITAADGWLHGNITALNASLAGAAGSVDSARDVMATANATSAASRAQVPVVRAAVTGVEQLARAINDPGTGAPPLATNLTAIGNASSYPGRVQVQEATGTNTSLPSPSSLARLLAGDMDGTQTDANRDALVAKLQAIHDKLAALPSLDAAAGALVALNATLTAAREGRTVSVLADELASLNATLAGFPSARRVNATFDAVDAAIAGIDVAPFGAALASVNGSLASFPSAAMAKDDVSAIAGVQCAIPCLAALSAELSSMNASVIRLPPELAQLTALSRELNATVQAAVAQVNTFNAALDALDTQMGNATQAVEAGLAGVRAMGAQVAEALAGFRNVTAGALQGMAGLPGLGNFSGQDGQLSELAAALESDAVVVPQAMVDKMNVLGAVTDAVIQQTRGGIVAIGTFARGRCGPGSTTIGVGDACTTTAQCGGSGACMFAERRCSGAAYGTVCPAGTDKPCPASSPCLFSSAQFVNLTAVLNAFAPDAVNDRPDTTELVAALDNLAAATSHVTDLSATQQTLDDISRGLAELPLGSALASVGDARAVLSDVDVSALSRELASLGGVIRGLPNLAAIRADLQALSGPLAAAESHVAQLSNVTAMVDAVGALFGPGLSGVVSRLGAAELARIANVEGVEALVLHVAGQLQQLLSAAQNASAAFGGAGLAGVNVSQSVQPILHYVRVLGASRYAAHGPLYFMGSLARLHMLDAASPLAVDGLVWGPGPAGRESYPDGRLCLTNDCVGRTVEWINGGSVDELSGGLIPLPVTRETLSAALLFAVPAVLAVLGLVGCVGSFCGGRWQRWFARGLACGSFCGAPVMFAVAGCLLFPLMLVGSDMCAGGENVAWQYLHGSYASLCTAVGGAPVQGGRGESFDTSPACHLNVSNSTLQFDVASLFADVMGGCNIVPPNNGVILDPRPGPWPVRGSSTGTGSGSGSSMGTGVEPVHLAHTVWSQLFFDVGMAIESAVTHQLVTSLQSVQGQVGEPRGPLRSQLLNTANAAGFHASVFVNSLSDHLSCAAVHSTVARVKEAICCSFVDSLTWLVVAWYVSLWAVILCGCTGGLCGIKRFPSHIGASASRRGGYVRIDSGARGGDAGDARRSSVRGKGTGIEHPRMQRSPSGGPTGFAGLAKDYDAYASQRSASSDATRRAGRSMHPPAPALSLDSGSGPGAQGAAADVDERTSLLRARSADLPSSAGGGAPMATYGRGYGAAPAAVPNSSRFAASSAPGAHTGVFSPSAAGTAAIGTAAIGTAAMPPLRQHSATAQASRHAARI